MFDLIFWLVAGNGDLDLSAAVVECHRPFRPLGASGTATLVVAPSSSSSSSAAAPLPVLPLTAANEFHTHDLPLASPCAHQSDSERSPMLIVVSAPTSSIHQLLSGWIELLLVIGFCLFVSIAGTSSGTKVNWLIWLREMITASTSLHQTQVSTANKLRNSPLSFSMSLSPGAASSASVASSVGGDSVATGASVGRSATPSPERPVSNHHHPHDLSSYSLNRRPGSAHSPGVVRGSTSPGPVPARAGESHSAHSALQASLGLCHTFTHF